MRKRIYDSITPRLREVSDEAVIGRDTCIEIVDEQQHADTRKAADHAK